MHDRVRKAVVAKNAEVINFGKERGAQGAKSARVISYPIEVHYGTPCSLSKYPIKFCVKIL
jgi:hypothetical protein